MNYINTHERIDKECPKCGFPDFVKFHATGEFGEKYDWRCMGCGYILKTEWVHKNENYIEPGAVKCPFCQSTDCKKISTASKVGKVALFGIFAAGSVSKTWHCNDCGSNFG